jgi:V-type H+-transporting ATPase subunit a
MQSQASKQTRLGFITGLVAKSKAAAFERILFRATRGNLFFKQAPVEQLVLDPATNEKVSILSTMDVFCINSVKTL